MHLSDCSELSRRFSCRACRFHGRFGQSCSYAGRALVAVAVLCSAAIGRVSEGADDSPAGGDVNYSIIVTGSELLSGVYADSHTHFLTRTLRPLGLHCVGSMSVDDREADIIEALQFTRRHSQLVIVTGGLGPTDSDITRDVLAKYTGIALHEQSDVLARMEKRFHTARDSLRANLRRQARVPVQGTYLKNAAGTAVGLVFEQDNLVIVALPGPPRELQPMVHKELVPYLARRFGTRTVGCSLTVRFVGIGQSQIDQTMKERMHLASDVLASSQFQDGRVDFTFALASDTPRDHARLEQLKKEFHKYLGDHMYADDAHITLEQSVIERLTQLGQTIALAEVGSGGSLAAALGHEQGVDQVIAGGYVAPTEDQLRRIVDVNDDAWLQAGSGRRTELLAVAAAGHSHSQWAVAVGKPQSDAKTDRRYIPCVLKRPDGQLEHARLVWRGTSIAGQGRLVTDLLDLLRRHLQ